MSKFKFYSANPFRKPKSKTELHRTDIGDCVPRALSLAFRMPYEQVCRKLHVPFRQGRGLNTNKGVTTEQVKKAFKQGVWMDYSADAQQSQAIKDLMDDPEFRSMGGFDQADMFGMEDDEFVNPAVKRNMTVSQFLDEYAGTGEWVLDLEIETNGAEGHYTFVDADSQTVYDTWDCRKRKVVGAYKALKKVSDKGLE